MNSTGGSIAINGGAAVALSTRVEAISVGDDGPAWHSDLVLFEDGFDQP
jgi:hypothetical protein